MRRFLSSAFFLIGLFGLFVSVTVFASQTDGTIDASSKYAWGSNIGWINFGTSLGNVHVTDTGLSGYAWSEHYGWINLRPTRSGVNNNGLGDISGYAWGEGLGYIDFSSVSIDSSGHFSGTASGTIAGTISFDCLHCAVVTDWRPWYARTGGGGGTGGGGIGAGGGSGGGGGGGGGGGIVSTTTGVASVLDTIKNKALDIFNTIFSLTPEPEPGHEAISVPRVTPFAFQYPWELLPRPAIKRFVFAPLSKDIASITKKLPTVGKLFNDAGIQRQTDLERVKNITLNIPGLSQFSGILPREIRPGVFAPVTGIPIASFGTVAKQALPSEIVFARNKNEKIDFNIALRLNEQGVVEKSIQTVAGEHLVLAVKPQASAKEVKGYLVFRSRTQVSSNKPKENQSLGSALASVLLNNPVFSGIALPKETEIHTDNLAFNDPSIEKRLSLMAFYYTDPDKDGIYTAEITVPRVAGQYDIVTVITYNDPDLGSRELQLTTVVDPEGYVYQLSGVKETRIPGAIVSLYYLDPRTNTYVLWPATEYAQENPQVTGVAGTYSFLVPQGYYSIEIEAPGYTSYKGTPFVVDGTREIHANIALGSRFGFIQVDDWKTVALIVLSIFFLIDFYLDHRRRRIEMSLIEKVVGKPSIPVPPPIP